MKRYTPDELAEVLRLHKLWWDDQEGGSRADLCDADLRGADLCDADLRGADLRGADLCGANLCDADTGRVKIESLRVFSGLYRYQCWAFITTEGTPWVRMGCLWKTVEEWDSIGIRNSNPNEFPDDHTEKSERRARAFEFTRAEALAMAEAFSNK